MFVSEWGAFLLCATWNLNLSMRLRCVTTLLRVKWYVDDAFSRDDFFIPLYAGKSILQRILTSSISVLVEDRQDVRWPRVGGGGMKSSLGILSHRLYLLITLRKVDDSVTKTTCRSWKQSLDHDSQVFLSNHTCLYPENCWQHRNDLPSLINRHFWQLIETLTIMAETLFLRVKWYSCSKKNNYLLSDFGKILSLRWANNEVMSILAIVYPSESHDKIGFTRDWALWITVDATATL